MTVRGWTRAAVQGLAAVGMVVAVLAGCSARHAQGSTTVPAGPGRATADSSSPPSRPPASSTTISRPGRPTPQLLAARADVPVLTYHQVRDWRPTDSPTARQLITPPRRFAAQLDALARAGYTTISGTQLLQHLLRGAPLPPRPLLLTFDDASQGQYTNALPILRRHRFVATFFVMTVVLDKPHWLSRAQVQTLDRMGMTIGAHTWDHRPVPGYAGQDWQLQLVRPARELARIVGHPVRLFAYPYGRWDRVAFPHLERAGYQAAFQLAGPIDPTGPQWTIRRIMVPPTWSTATLLRRIASSF